MKATASKRSPFPSRRFPSSGRALVVLIAAVFAPIGTSFALPTGEQVVAGSASVSRPTMQNLTVQQSSPRAIINWQSFSIAAPERVSFQQPSFSSVALNRVIGTSASEIAGRMTANGQVFLINPNGVLFTSSAVVDVGGLVASTLDISNQDFMAGRYRFSGTGGSVTNAGSLRASDGGTIALLGGQVQNNGTINANLGTVALAAGNRVTLDFAGDGLTKVSVSESALAAAVENRGAVIADGGQVILTAHAAEALTQTVVNQTGLVQARTLTERAGKIVLDGGDTGQTLASGTLDASGREPGQKGGEIQVLGHHVGITSTALLDASGDAGGGSVLVGGDYQGKNPAIRNAAAVWFGPDATIRADALTQGDGGKVIVWSEEATRAYGTITARGGAQSGDGGLVETSGKYLETVGVRVNASAPNGAAGNWLLDPIDITIQNGPVGDTTGVDPSPNFTSNAFPAVVTSSSVQAALNNDTSVTITTSPTTIAGVPAQLGDIVIAANTTIDKTGGNGDATFRLNALNDIIVGDATRISSSSGRLTVEFNSDAAPPGGGPNNVGAIFIAALSIQTNGGDVRMFGGSDPVSGRASSSPGTALAGVQMVGTTINTVPLTGGAGGSVEIRGGGPTGIAGSSGVSIVGSTINAGAGSISINGIGTTGAPGAVGAAGAPGGPGVVMSGSSLQTATGNINITGVGGAGGAGGAGRLPGLAVALPGGSGGAGGPGVSLSLTPGPAGPAIQTSSGFIGIASFGGNGGAGGAGATDAGGFFGSVSGGSGGDGGAGLTSTTPPILISATILTGTGIAEFRGSGGAGGAGGKCDTGSCGFGGNGGVGVLQNWFVQAQGGSVEVRGFGGDGGQGGAGLSGSSGGFGGAGGAGISTFSGGASIVGTSGSITLNGTGGLGAPGSLAGGAPRPGSEGFSGEGVSLFGGVADNSTIETTSGDIFITGVSSSVFANRGATGLTLLDVIIKTTAGGSIDIRGRGEAPATAFSRGVEIDSPSTIQTQGAPGTITISGESTGADFGVVFGESEGGGINLVGGPTTSGNIVIRAANAGGGDSIELGGNITTIQTTGVINLRPGAVSATGALTSADSETIEIATEPVPPPEIGTFRLSPADLDTLAGGAAAIVIGGNTHTGPISVLTPYTFKDNVTLQNAGEGSLGIAINAALSGPGLITLSSAGPVTQTAPINASALLLHGTGSGSNGSNFTLTDTSNSVARFAADSPLHGGVQFVDSRALSIEPLSGTGIDTATNLPTIIAAPNTISFHDLFVRAAGDLALGHNISTVGSEITLVTGGAFTNPGNGQLLPGGTGRWTVWANILPPPGPAGDSRGGLVPSSSRPNIYGCTYPGPCSSGATVPPTGNHFVYQQQPPLTFTTPEPQLQRTYGDVNPTVPPTSLSGVRTDLGDTQADAVNPQIPELPPPNANVGTYRLTGTFSSPAGYIFQPPPEGANQITRTVTLDITPATLAYVANPATREYGLDNPAFSGTVTGFRLSETQQSATTGTLAFASPATPASPVGRYAILGSGLTANNGNYVFVPDPSSEIALSITPAPLTYVANPVSREYGFPNPALRGTVAGFRNADTKESATTGVLTFTTPASPISNPGVYPVVGSGLTPNGNYQFSPPEQAPSNATALTVTPQQTGYQLVTDIPTFDRTPGFRDTNVYASGFLLPSMCIATEPMVSSSGLAASGDILEIEWTRVRVRPKLTNCVSIGDKDYCRDF